MSNRAAAWARFCPQDGHERSSIAPCRSKDERAAPRTDTVSLASKPVWTRSERAAIHDEGYDPDDPAVMAALDRVRAELAGVGYEPFWQFSQFPM